MSLQVTLSLAGGGAPIVFGLVVMGLTDLFLVPVFFFVLGISIILLINQAFRYGGIGLGISAILYAIVYFVEPQWLSKLLGQI